MTPLGLTQMVLSILLMTQNWTSQRLPALFQNRFVRPIRRRSWPTIWLSFPSNFKFCQIISRASWTLLIHLLLLTLILKYRFQLLPDFSQLSHRMTLLSLFIVRVPFFHRFVNVTAQMVPTLKLTGRRRGFIVLLDAFASAITSISFKRVSMANEWMAVNFRCLLVHL